MMIVAGVVLFANHGSSAHPSSTWQAEKVRLENLIQAGKCAEYWDVLWPSAKEGNLEARAILLTLLAPPVHGTQVFAPGSAGDLVSRLRDIVIMAVHTSDYRGSEDSTKYYRELAYDLYLKNGFDQTTDGQEFLKCVREEANGCAEIAVKGHLVPSFEDYANQVNSFINSGMKSTCEPAYEKSK